MSSVLQRQGQARQASLPVMIFVSMFGHAAAILFFLIAPGLIPQGTPEPFGGSGPGGNVMWVTASSIGKEGDQEELTIEEPAPARYIKALTAEEDVPLPSDTEFPDPKKKKKEDEPTAKETLNQRERKLDGEFGKGKDTKKESGESGTEGKSKTGVGIGIGGEGKGDGGTGTGIPFPFPWYVDIVKTKIELAWRKPFLQETTPEGYSTVLYFVILRNGQVQQVKIEEPSGISSLDRSCESAILGASPFPPLPNQWTEPNLAFRLTFQYAPQ